MQGRENSSIGALDARPRITSMASQYAGIQDVHHNESSTVLAEPVRVPMKRAWGGFIMAAIEAVCVFYIAAAKAGLVLVSANIAAGVWASVVHQDIFRIPLLA